MKSIYQLTLLLLLATPFAFSSAQPAADMKRKDVFGPEKLWTIRLTIGAKEYQDMTPKGGGNPFGFPFGKKEEPKKKEPVKKDGPAADVHKSKGFGMEFPWVKADIEFERKVVKEVAIRYTGNSTYTASANSIKRPFKVDVNRYHDKQKVFGMGSFNLRTQFFDQTRIREALAYHLYREAKVPASRAAFIKVYLTVPEKHDNAYVGLYTLVEPVDKPFLATHFKNDNGMLLKPERVQGLPYLGEKWESYVNSYNPKREPNDAQKKRLIEFTKFLNQADDARFKRDIDKYLDVDGFLRYAAVTSLTGNLDSFLGLGHNYFIYLHPKTNKFHFIPWDLDLTFGGMVFGGGDQTEWSIAQPYMGKNRLAERVLAIKDYDVAYRGHLKSLAEGAFSPKAMNATIAQLEKTIKETVAKEPVQKGGFGFGFPGKAKKDELRNFVTKRSESVLAQLDGKSQGKAIAGFGFGGPGKGGPGGFGMGQRLAKPILEATDTNKDGKLSLEEFKVAAGKLFKESGGDENTSVTEAALIDTINRLMPAPKGFGDFKLPPPPKGFGPGKGIAGAMIKQGGAGADKKLSRDQFMGGAAKLFAQWDKNKSGTLNETELIDGLNQFIPAPDFGAPKFGPNPFDPKKGPPAKELNTVGK